VKVLMPIKRNRLGMTLMEMIIVVVLIGILATVGAVGYRKTVEQARQKEARSMLRLIQHAEEVRRLEMNTYVACADTAACNTALHLDLPAGDWAYSVTASGNASFCAQALSANFGNFSINNGTADPTANGCS
jgi:Tfp pilus assembly protein PilE